jgi:hypothetical protein
MAIAVFVTGCAPNGGITAQPASEMSRGIPGIEPQSISTAPNADTSDRISQISYLDASPTPADSPRFSATGSFIYGPVNGYVQTPSGGAPGSTSRKRPRLGELGISTATIGAAEVDADWGPHEIFGSAEIIRLSGSESLRSDLQTHGTNFAAGTFVHSDLSMDWYRVGYRNRISLGPDNADPPKYLIAPYLDLALWNFNYQIRGGGASTSRGYLKPTVQLGIQGQWRPGSGPFSVLGDFSASPPGISSLPFIAAEQVAARYQFAATSQVSIIGTAGVRFEQFNFFDNQRVSNHVRANFGPMLIVGLGVEF